MKAFRITPKFGGGKRSGLGGRLSRNSAGRALVFGGERKKNEHLRLLLAQDCASNRSFAKIAHPRTDVYHLRAMFYRTVYVMQNRCNIGARLVYSLERRLARPVVGIILLSGICTTDFAGAGQQPQKSANRADPSRGELSGSFEVPRSDVANAEALANKLAALSPRVDSNEARSLAECAYATADRLRGQYRMFGTPIFNNFLVYHGLRKRGYCYQWTADLLVALDALKLKTLELHWGETYAGTWRENNCLVITARGQPFDSGMIVDAWRHFGHLRWNLVRSDQDRYFENAKWADRVRPHAANRHVALQSKVAPNGKAPDR